MLQTQLNVIIMKIALLKLDSLCAIKIAMTTFQPSDFKDILLRNWNRRKHKVISWIPNNILLKYLILFAQFKLNECLNDGKTANPNTVAHRPTQIHTHTHKLTFNWCFDYLWRYNLWHGVKVYPILVNNGCWVYWMAACRTSTIQHQHGKNDGFLQFQHVKIRLYKWNPFNEYMCLNLSWLVHKPSLGRMSANILRFI